MSDETNPPAVVPHDSINLHAATIRDDKGHAYPVIVFEFYRRGESEPTRLMLAGSPSMMRGFEALTKKTVKRALVEASKARYDGIAKTLPNNLLSQGVTEDESPNPQQTEPEPEAVK